MEPENVLKTGAASTVAGDISAVTHADVTKSDRTPINPDELHDLFQGPADGDKTDPEDPFAQMRNDPNYAALLKDLEAIAEAARQLFATEEEEPSAAVWDKIQRKLDTEQIDPPK